MSLEEEFSEEWMQLIRRKEEFEKAAIRFNNVDEEKKFQDLSKSLKNTDLFEQISVLKMMGEGHRMGGGGIKPFEYEKVEG